MFFVGKPKSIFDSSPLYIASAAITIFLVLVFFILKIYINNFDRTIHKLETEADRIDRAFVNTMDLTAEIMKMIAAQVAPNYEDIDYVHNILYKYKANPNIFNLFSWTAFSWVNVENKIVIDGIYGKLYKPIDISGREYLKKFVEMPNQFILGDVVIGITSKRRMIPAGVGVTDYSGKYIGAITVGFDTIKLANRLADNTKSEGVEFILFDKNFNLILSNNLSNISPEGIKKIISNSLVYQKPKDLSSKISNLLRGNNYFIHKFSRYPYIIYLNFDNLIVQQDLWNEITSRIIEILAIGLVSCLLVVYIYKREVFLRRQAEESREIAIRASKAKSDFLAYTAHELRSPLSFIVTASEIIKNQLFGKLPEKYLEYTQNIYQSGVELIEFIEDLLDEIRTEKGNFKIQNKLIIIGEIFSKLIVQNKYKFKKAGIRINSDIQSGLPKLYSDPRRLMQILDNLINNSIKYSSKNTVVNISAKLVEKNLHLVVKDQGFGIEDKKLAFSQYGTIQNKNSNKVKSVGLGLPLVKILAETLGAKIHIESKKNIGTTITIIFESQYLRNPIVTQAN